MYAFTRTPVGRMCNAVRDNPERAEFVGYNTQRVRFIAFAIAGLFAGLAGGLHAINYEIVAADAVSAQRSGTVLIMAYIGGAGHFIGPVLGAIVITWLQSSLSDYTSAWLLYLGVFFIAMILYAPSGLAGLIVAASADRALAGARRRARRVRRRAGAARADRGAGAVLLIEMSYRLSTQPELGTRMRLLWTRARRRVAVAVDRRRGGARRRIRCCFARRWPSRRGGVGPCQRATSRHAMTAACALRVARRREALRRDARSSAASRSRSRAASATRSSARTAPASRRCST